MTAQRIGYGRVSTRDQNTNDQEDALWGKGKADKVFVEKFTGTKSSRPEWNRVKEILRPGDTLVITRLDRLGRSSKDLADIGEWLRENKIELKATDQPIDTSTPEGQMFYTILSAFAQFEHDLIVVRTLDGLAAAKARGRAGGRKAKISAQQAAAIRKRSSDGESVQELAASYGVSRPTIYRALEKVKG